MHVARGRFQISVPDMLATSFKMGQSSIPAVLFDLTPLSFLNLQLLYPSRKPKAKNAKKKKKKDSVLKDGAIKAAGRSALTVPRGLFGSSDDGSYEPGRIPGMSEDLTTSNRLIESARLIQIGLSLLLHHADVLIRFHKSDKVQGISPRFTGLHHPPSF